MDICLSNGKILKDCVLYVRNVTGIAEERGFRLFWVKGDGMVPALGLATSNPFSTARAAINFGQRMGWGFAKIMRS